MRIAGWLKILDYGGIVFPAWRRQVGRLALAGGAGILIVALNLVEPLIVRSLTDNAILSGNLRMALTLMAYWLALFGAQHLALWFRVNALIGAAEHAAADVRKDLLRSLLAEDPQFYRRRDRGDLLLELTKDIDDVRPLWAEIPILTTMYILTVAGAAACALVLSWRLALYLLGIILLLALIGRVASFGSQRAATISRKKLETLAQTFRRALAEVKIIQMYEANDYVVRQAADKIHETQSARQRLGLWQWAGKTIGNGLEFCALAGVLGIGGYMVVRGSLSFGALLAFVLYINLLAVNYQNLATRMVEMNQGKVAALKIGATLSSGASEEIHEEKPVLSKKITHIDVDKLSFEYRKDARILDTASASFISPSLVVITGSNGAGKTTLLDLIAGFVNPFKGAIKINGESLSDLDLRSYRRQLALVSQDDLVLEGTVEENLRLALPAASIEDMTRVLRQVGFSETEECAAPRHAGLLNAPAETLSGGQQRRLALARAVLREPACLLLDEPCANLDEVSTKMVRDVVVACAQKALVIVATHDTGWLSSSARIFSLQNGSLYEIDAELPRAADKE